MLVKSRFALIVALICALKANCVFACDPCGLHNSVQVPGLINTLRATGLRSGSFTLGLQQQLSTFKVRGENDLRTTEADLELIKTLSVQQVSAGYNLSNSLSAQVNVPFIIRTYDTFQRFRQVKETEAGFGDISLNTTFAPYSSNDVGSRVFIAAIGGVKLPTGDTGSLRRVASEDPSTADQRIQGRGLTLGTGALDIPLGLVSYARVGRLVGFTSAQYTVRGEGAANYRFANDLIWNTAPGYLFLLGEDQSLSLSVVMSGEHKGDDRLNGDPLTKTSANNLYLGPEIFYSSSSSLSLQFAMDMPVTLDVGGAAVKPETRWRVAISMGF